MHVSSASSPTTQTLPAPRSLVYKLDARSRVLTRSCHWPLVCNRLLFHSEKQSSPLIRSSKNFSVCLKSMLKELYKGFGGGEGWWGWEGLQLMFSPSFWEMTSVTGRGNGKWNWLSARGGKENLMWISGLIQSKHVISKHDPETYSWRECESTPRNLSINLGQVPGNGFFLAGEHFVLFTLFENKQTKY